MGNITDINEAMTLGAIVQETEHKVSNLNYAEIQKYIENLPDQHHAEIERCIRTRSPELLGSIILMGIYQQVQDEVANNETT